MLILELRELSFKHLSLEFDFFFIMRHLSLRSFSFRKHLGVGNRNCKFFGLNTTHIGGWRFRPKTEGLNLFFRNDRNHLRDDNELPRHCIQLLKKENLEKRDRLCRFFRLYDYFFYLEHYKLMYYNNSFLLSYLLSL